MDRTHETRVEIDPAPPSELEAGAEFRFRVGTACGAGCDLAGRRVRILGPDGGILHEALLGSGEGAIHWTEEIVLRAPGAGECRWKVVFSAADQGPARHDEVSIVVAARVRPHATSVAVWDVPSPLVLSRPARAKVGVRCSAGCSLTGQRVEVVDDAGAALGGGELGPLPWPGTAALYWTECEVGAAAMEGAATRTVRFPVPDLDLPHEPAAHSFSVLAVPPPEHAVTVKVLEKGAGTPVDAAEVRLGPYRGRTDAAGLATVGVPAGKHALHVWKEGYALAKEMLEVRKDRRADIEIEPAPEPEEEYWM